MMVWATNVEFQFIFHIARHSLNECQPSKAQRSNCEAAGTRDSNSGTPKEIAPRLEIRFPNGIKVRFDDARGDLLLSLLTPLSALPCLATKLVHVAGSISPHLCQDDSTPRYRPLLKQRQYRRQFQRHLLFGRP